MHVLERIARMIPLCTAQLEYLRSQCLPKLDKSKLNLLMFLSMNGILNHYDQLTYIERSNTKPLNKSIISCSSPCNLHIVQKPSETQGYKETVIRADTRSLPRSRTRAITRAVSAPPSRLQWVRMSYSMRFRM